LTDRKVEVEKTGGSLRKGEERWTAVVRVFRTYVVPTFVFLSPLVVCVCVCVS